MKSGWNPPPIPRQKVIAPKDSWWVVGCDNSAEGRATFIVAAHEGACAVWGSKTADHPARVKA